MAFLESFLISTLYRFACPEPQELGEYHLGMLARDRTEQIQTHLQDCPRCTQEVGQLHEYLESLKEDLEIPLSARIKTWIARLLPADGFGGGLMPVAGLRGNAAQVIAYQAGDAQLSLLVQEDPQQPEYRSVLGLLIGAPPENAQAILFQKNRQLQSVNVDELGNFVFPGVKKGQYELLLRGTSFEIDVSPFVIE